MTAAPVPSCRTSTNMSVGEVDEKDLLLLLFDALFDALSSNSWCCRHSNGHATSAPLTCSSFCRSSGPTPAKASFSTNRIAAVQKITGVSKAPREAQTFHAAAAVQENSKIQLTLEEVRLARAVGTHCTCKTTAARLKGVACFLRSGSLLSPGWLTHPLR